MSGEKLGPGAYYNQEKTTMVKKSFNMALEGFKFAWLVMIQSNNIKFMRNHYYCC